MSTRIQSMIIISIEMKIDEREKVGKCMIEWYWNQSSLNENKNPLMLVVWIYRRISLVLSRCSSTMLKWVEQTSKYSISLRTGGEEQLDFHSLFREKSMCFYCIIWSCTRSPSIGICARISMSVWKELKWTLRWQIRVRPLVRWCPCALVRVSDEWHIDTCTTHSLVHLVPLIDSIQCSIARFWHEHDKE